ncbi:hypothetical protein FN960_03140 [Alkalicoccobacillus porphyridii]|uniref:LHH domain-containing protein n=2 Tax=Alkalicoccobacillus porphyridii TaxID=2597270 RepID=A0A554A4M1_9BACI|nr:hypothetical protein FN960_03140 [Alkalicoccobacillus porphyridii]
MDQMGMNIMQPIEERIALISSFLQEITARTIDGSLSPIGYKRSQIEDVQDWQTIASQNAAVRNAHMAKIQETQMYGHTLPTEYLYKGMYEQARIDPEVSPWYYMEHLPVSAEVNTEAAVKACGPPPVGEEVERVSVGNQGYLDGYINFFKGVGQGIWNAGKDTLEGLNNLVTDPLGVYNDTKDFVVAVVDDPAILVEMGQALVDSFERDVINGDVQSAGQWYGYAAAIVGTSVVGDKGISKVGGAGKLGKVGGSPGNTSQHNVGVQLSTQNPVSKPSLTSTIKQTGLNGVNAMNDFAQKTMTSTAQFANQTAQNVQRVTNKAIDKSVEAMSNLAGTGTAAFATVTNAGRAVPPPPNVLNAAKIQSDLRVANQANLRKVEAKAGYPNIYWNKVATFNGVKVYQRNDLIDPNLKDARGRTNIERMSKGLAPLGPDGKSINLHHTIQKHDGSIAEVTHTFHKTNSSIIHINPNTIPSGIDRKDFNKWRASYWKSRKNDFIGE